MTITETSWRDLVDEATDLIINTRDFCGDERAAVAELANEHRLGRMERNALFAAANFKANARWNKFKKLAGVNPKHCF